MTKKMAAKETKVTLKIAKKAVWITPDGRRRLTLSNMGITAFPKCIFKVTNVDELDLSRNQIQKLPDNIGNLSSLRWLDLHSNKLESVPESIGNLMGLTHLNLCNNRLTSASLPSTLGLLRNLKTLNLGLNQLDNLPTTLMELENLQELGLYDNLFINLPEFLKDFSKISKVNVKRNPLSCVQGDDEGMTKGKSEPEKKGLVHEGILCGKCLSKYKEQRERLLKGRRRAGRRGGGFEEPRKITYSGLVAPNSVATINQDLWRIKINN